MRRAVTSPILRDPGSALTSSRGSRRRSRARSNCWQDSDMAYIVFIHLKRHSKKREGEKKEKKTTVSLSNSLSSSSPSSPPPSMVLKMRFVSPTTGQILRKGWDQQYHCVFTDSREKIKNKLSRYKQIQYFRGETKENKPRTFHGGLGTRRH